MPVSKRLLTFLLAMRFHRGMKMMFSWESGGTKRGKEGGSSMQQHGGSRCTPGRSGSGPGRPGLRRRHRLRPGLRLDRPAVAAQLGPEPPGAWILRCSGQAGPARPSSPQSPPSRCIPGRSRSGPDRPGRSAVAAQFGPEPPGARLVRPGLWGSISTQSAQRSAAACEDTGVQFPPKVRSV